MVEILKNIVIINEEKTSSTNVTESRTFSAVIEALRETLEERNCIVSFLFIHRWGVVVVLCSALKLRVGYGYVEQEKISFPITMKQ